MLITFNTSIASLSFAYAEGETADIEETEALRLIEAGHARKTEVIEQANIEPDQKAIRRAKRTS